MKQNTGSEGKHTFIFLLIIGALGYIINPFGMFRETGFREAYHAGQAPSPTPCIPSQTSGYLLEGGKLVVPTTAILVDDPCAAQSPFAQIFSDTEQTILTADQSAEMLNSIMQQLGETAVITRIQVQADFGPGLITVLEPIGTANQVGPYFLQDFAITKDTTEQVRYSVLFQNTTNTWQIVEVYRSEEE